jgi:uncharacterized protein YfaP (DUF2135 family)
MKKMKNEFIKPVLIFVTLFFVTIAACKKSDNNANEIKGNPGNPRFNLQFTNEENVDLDLHVLTPSGKEIYYSNKKKDGGELDIDCLCSNCPNGPNENIFWTEGTAPKGTYKFWVEYYGSCRTSGSASTYTIRRLRNSEVQETFTGTLTNGKSPVYSFTY